MKAFVPLPGGGTAIYGPSGLMYYRHSDWLGSSRLASTPTRALYYDAAYAPFGESYAETGTSDRSFTGENQDTVPGSYDFLFREFSGSQQGRWISPDPAGMAAVNIANPQTWNRYSYVGNSPLIRIDPLGLDDSGSIYSNPFCPTCASYSLILVYDASSFWYTSYFNPVLYLPDRQWTTIPFSTDAGSSAGQSDGGANSGI